MFFWSRAADAVVWEVSWGLLGKLGKDTFIKVSSQGLELAEPQLEHDKCSECYYIMVLHKALCGSNAMHMTDGCWHYQYMYIKKK